MKDEGKLHQQLNRPPVPNQLQEHILSNWRQQRDREQRSIPAVYKVAAGLGVLALAALLYLTAAPSQDLVQLAMADIKKDNHHQYGIALPVSEVLQSAKINMPPGTMSVELSKACDLGENKTLHLKVTGAKQGAVHLFIKTGAFSHSAGIDTDKPGTMPWKVIQPRENLSVLVLYTTDMNPVSVDQLLQTMFYT